MIDAEELPTAKKALFCRGKQLHRFNKVVAKLSGSLKSPF